MRAGGVVQPGTRSKPQAGSLQGQKQLPAIGIFGHKGSPHRVLKGFGLKSMLTNLGRCPPDALCNPPSSTLPFLLPAPRWARPASELGDLGTGQVRALVLCWVGAGH